MATNNIKPFATGEGANVLTDSELASRSELQTGFPFKSKADSKLMSKLIQDASAGAYALGSFTVKYADADVTGSDAGGLATNFESALTAFVEENAPTPDLEKYMPLAGGTFTGAVTVQEPTANNHPATKQYVDSAVASVYKYRGSVDTQASLPSSNQAVGDVYNVEDTGDNFAWDGTQWDKLAGTVDLSGYLTTTNASATYLTKTDAGNTYQVKGDYLVESDLDSYARLDGPTFTIRPKVGNAEMALSTEVDRCLQKYVNYDSSRGTYDAVYTQVQDDCFAFGPNVQAGSINNHKFSFWFGAGYGIEHTAILNIGEHARVTVSGGDYLNYIQDGLSINGIKGEIVWMQDGQVNKTVAFTSDLNSYVAKQGTRGALAGYEDITVGSVAITINQDSPDSQQITAAVAITVSDGSANQSWVKKVSIKDASTTISLGSAWSWAGGSQPTVTAPSLLVLSWDNDCGIAVLQTTA